MASRFAFEEDGIRHDVDGDAACDNADIGRRLVVDAAEPHARDTFSGDLNGADASLRANTGVRFEAVNFELEAVRRRRTGEKKAYRVTVEHESRARPEARYVETLGPDEPRLFADGKDDVDRPA